MKTFLPLCAAALLLAVSLPLSAAPDADRGAVLRDEMETRLQLLEGKLSLQQERRLTELENELKQLREERKTWSENMQNPIIALAEKKKEEVRATGDRYVSMVSAGFTALGVLAAIVALVPAIFSIANTVSFNESAKQKLDDIKRMWQEAKKINEKNITEFKEEAQKKFSELDNEANKKFAELDRKSSKEIAELDNAANKKIEIINNLIARYEKTQQELEEIKNRIKDSVYNSQEKIPQETVNDAFELVNKGKGIDVLWGKAIIAMKGKNWEKACSYFEKIVQQTPEDIPACLNLAKCQMFLGDSKKNITPEERKKLFSTAEQYYKDTIEKETDLSNDIKFASFMMYAQLKNIQAKYVEAKERKRLYKEAETLLQQAKNAAPQDAHSYRALGLLKQEIANDNQTPLAERDGLLLEAESLLGEACKLDPQNENNYLALALFKLDLSKKERDPAARKKLRLEEEKLLLQASALSPQDAYIIGMLGDLKQAQANDESDPEVRKELRLEAIQLFEKVRMLTPQEPICYRALGEIKQEWANDPQTEPAARVVLRLEAELLLLQANRFDPQNAGILYLLAQLKHEQATEASDPQSRASLLNAAEQFLLRAKRLDPQNALILHALACIKYSQYQEETASTVRATLMSAAEELLLQARELDPEDMEILSRLANIKLEQARDATAEDRDGILAAAEKYLDELPPEEHAKNLYNRACIAALRGQQERALKLLEECRKAGTLPPRTKLETNKGLDSLRELDAFKEFMERAYPKDSGQTNAKNDTEDSE